MTQPIQPGAGKPTQGAGTQLSLPSLTATLATLTVLHGKLQQAGNKNDAEAVQKCIGVISGQIKDLRNVQQGLNNLTIGNK